MRDAAAGGPPYERDGTAPDRMAQYSDRTARTSGTRSVLLAVLAAFVLGGAVAGLAAWRFDWPDRLNHALLGGQAPSSATVAMAPRPASATPMASAALPPAAQDPALQRVAEQQGGLEQRLAAAEQRLARLDLQAEAASGNAARAEGLLIAFAARRAVERGTELGFLADQLRLRFGDALPNAVDTVVRGANDPVTLDRLVTQLDSLSPELSVRNRQFSFEALTDELSSLFVVRRDTTPSIQPAERLERAKLFLQSGRVPAAIAEVRNLPGAAGAGGWIADAQRYAAMQRALDLIETSAVLEPRRLRDRNGVAVEQLSPAAP